MATYTANYQLHQWVAEDQFLRTDFNTDFQKIDAALAGLEAGKVGPEALEPLKSDIASVRTIANGKARAMVGSYRGNGVCPRTVSVGAPVKGLILLSASDLALAVSGGNKPSQVSVTSSGFRIESNFMSMNTSGSSYTYLAIV